MRQLKFTYNWNRKLDCKYFTTLRIGDEWAAGMEVEILLNDVFVKKGLIVEVKSFTIDKINNFVAGIDMGYSAADAIKTIKTMYHKADINWDKKMIRMLLVKELSAPQMPQ